MYDEDEDNEHARLTPEKLAALCIDEAVAELAKAPQDSARWFFAASNLHRALNCALIAALRGTASIGAYPEEGRRQWLAYFERSRTDEKAKAPNWSHVESFTKLLERAQDPNEVEMGGYPLALTETQKEDLSRLTYYRDRLEHVKPGAWSLEAGGLPRILGAAAEALDQLFSNNRVGLYLSERHHQMATDGIFRIKAVAAENPSTPPRSR